MYDSTVFSEFCVVVCFLEIEMFHPSFETRRQATQKKKKKKASGNPQKWLASLDPLSQELEIKIAKTHS